MGVEINQAGANHQAAGGEAVRSRRGFGGGGWAEGGDFSVQNQQVRYGIEAIGGVNDAPAGDEDGFWQVHRGRIMAEKN